MILNLTGVQAANFSDQQKSAARGHVVETSYRPTVEEFERMIRKRRYNMVIVPYDLEYANDIMNACPINIEVVTLAVVLYVESGTHKFLRYDEYEDV